MPDVFALSFMLLAFAGFGAAIASLGRLWAPPCPFTSSSAPFRRLGCSLISSSRFCALKISEAPT